MGSEYDLEQIQLRNELAFLDDEISSLRAKISNLSDELRWACIKRQDILGKIGKK